MSYNPYNPTVANPQAEAVRRGVMTQVYAWMTAGLLSTGAVAALVANTALGDLIVSTPLYFVLFLAEIALVWYLGARVFRMSAVMATTMFMVYSLLNGLTLSAIFYAYTSESIASTFFITGGMFGAMSAIGYVTKRDLSGWGNFLFMGLIGFLLASIVNIFVASSALYWIVTYFGIALFIGLTVYDTNKIKRLAASVNNETDAQRVAIFGALNLYLDFINLFLLLLRLFGNRR